MSSCIGVQNVDDIVHHLGETIERDGHRIKFIPNKDKDQIEKWVDGVLVKIIK